MEPSFYKDTIFENLANNKASQEIVKKLIKIGESKNGQLKDSKKVKLDRKIQNLIKQHEDQFEDKEKSVIQFIRMQIFSKTSKLKPDARDEFFNRIATQFPTFKQLPDPPGYILSQEREIPLLLFHQRPRQP